MLNVYSTGTVSVAANGTVVTGAGMIWTSGNAREGDHLHIGSASAEIVAVVSATELQIMPWPGDEASGAAYVIRQNSPVRFENSGLAIDLMKQVAALNTEGFYHFVKPDQAEPDPSLGDEGQYAFQAATGKMWVKTAGVWVALGIYKGANPRGPWAAEADYAVNDIVSDGGRSFLAMVPNTNDRPPSASWMLLADRGGQGDDGEAGTIEIVSVTTLPPATPAFVNNVGTAQHAQLEIGLPAGHDGGGAGNVKGPSASTDEELAAFDGTTGDKLKGTGTKVSDLLTKQGNLAGLTDPVAARTNLGIGTPTPRNYIINGNFDIWQRGTSLSGVTGSNFLADRWRNLSVGSTMTVTRNTFAPGATDAPGNPAFFQRIQVGSVAGVGNFVVLQHKMEDVRTLAGKRITITFYAYADAAANIALEMEQFFGVGGSAAANYPLGLIPLTSAWTKVQKVFDVPNVTGKTLGDMNTFNFNIWLDAGSGNSVRASNLGQRSGFYGISHVSIVEGDAREVADPFSPRHIQQELALCQRYYCRTTYNIRGYDIAGGVTEDYAYFPTTMRAIPTTAIVMQGSNANCTVVPGTTASVNGSRIVATAVATGQFYELNGTISADAEL